jgi:3-hydroxybutyryl-CoA dehydrogenase
MIRIIGVIGAGTMGTGIAQVAALSGFEVVLHDVAQPALKNALARMKEDLRKGVEKGRISTADAAKTLSAIHPRRDLKDFGDVDLVIEAAVENMQVKKELFRKLDQVVQPHTILASNTSSLSISGISSLTKTPESVVGMHFFNPAPVMKLVEVVRGAQTSDETVKAVCSAAVRMKKTPVVCSDSPGFIVNRVARPFYGEALRLLGEGVASVEDIDRIARSAGGFRMGPFELMDLIGIDVNYAVTSSLYEQCFNEPRFRPHPIQRRMVESGRLGRKTGRGFYAYE